MSSSANPFKTRNFITNYFCLVKQKGKMDKSFVFVWTSEASVSRRKSGVWNLKTFLGNGVWPRSWNPVYVHCCIIKKWKKLIRDRQGVLKGLTTNQPCWRYCSWITDHVYRILLENLSILWSPVITQQFAFWLAAAVSCWSRNHWRQNKRKTEYESIHLYTEITW